MYLVKGECWVNNMLLDGVMFKKFIKAANYHSPALESLVLCFPRDEEPPEIPATFLRGPDRPDLPLRRLKYVGSIASIVSGPLSSAKALTDLTLNVTTPDRDAAVFEPSRSQVSSLLACLQGMQCLRNLDLTISYPGRKFLAQDSQHFPGPTVSMSELARFCYIGPTTFLNHLVSRLSAPSLQDVSFLFFPKSTIPYLSRVADVVRKEFRSASVTFNRHTSHLSSSTQLGEIYHFKPSESSFRFKVNCFSHSVDSTKLAMAEGLTLNSPSSKMRRREGVDLLREFIRQFPKRQGASSESIRAAGWMLPQAIRRRRRGYLSRAGRSQDIRYRV